VGENMDRVEEILNKALSFLCISLMGSLSFLVILCVILRYVFSISFVWTEELITILFLATTYFGLVLGVKHNEHIQIEFLTEKYGQRGKAISDVIIGLIVIFVQIIVFRASIVWIQKVGNVLSPGMRIPNKMIYAMFPISCILVAFYEVWKIKSVVLDILSGKLSNQKSVGS
jgi:TRAP-type C4-dicarboxylate transport system permease small subunit